MASTTVKLQAVDWTTIQLWKLLAKGHSIQASNFPFINILKMLWCATNAQLYSNYLRWARI